MLHAKFQDHRTSGSGEYLVFTIYGHGGHLGHVTWTIYRKISNRSPCSNKRPPPDFDAKNGNILDDSGQNKSLY